MAETLSITIVAKDGTTSVFKKIANDAQQMGDVVEDAGKRGNKGLSSLKENADKIGSGMGAVVGAVSLAGQAFVNQERQLDTLGRQYGVNSDRIIEFAERIQDSTRYSNDAAREAATIAATLANQYGMSIDQIETVLSRSADLAQTSGQSLTYASEAVIAALRGEAEMAERLGLTLNDANVARYAAAQGIDNYSSGLDEAGRAQLRYNLFLEQSAFATGAAGDAANTAAGQASQFANTIQDGVQSLGGFIGPAAEAASVLGIWALALPVAGRELGKVGQAAATTGRLLGTARIGALGFSAALGPITLAATAIGAIALGFKAIADNAHRADEAVAGVGASLVESARLGVDPTIVQNLQNDINQVLSSQLVAEVEILPSVPLGRWEAAATPIERIVTDIFDDNARSEIANNLAQIIDYAFVQGGPNADRVIAELNRLNASFDPANPQAYRDGIAALVSTMDTFGLVTIDANGNIVLMSDSAGLAAVEIQTLGEALAETGNQAEVAARQFALVDDAVEMGLSPSRLVGLRALRDGYDEIRRQILADESLSMEERIIQASAVTALIDEVDAEINTEIAGIVETVDAGADAVFGSVWGFFSGATDATEDGGAAWAASIGTASRAASDALAEAAKQRADSMGSLIQEYQEALNPATATFPVLEGLEAMVATGELARVEADGITAAFGRLGSMGASTLQVTAGLFDAMGYAGTEALGFAADMDAAATSLGDANSLIVTTTSNLLGLFGASAGVVDDLFGGDPTDGVGPLVDLLEQGLITEKEFNQAREAGLLILEDQRRAETAVNEIRAHQLGYLQEQTDAMATYLEQVAGMEPAEARRALYLMDANNQQALLNTSSLIYAAQIGSLPDQVVTDMVLSRAAWDPEYARILEEAGVLERDPITQELSLVIGEDQMTATLTTLNATLEDLAYWLEQVGGESDNTRQKLENLAGVDLGNLRGQIGAAGNAVENGVLGWFSGGDAPPPPGWERRGVTLPGDTPAPTPAPIVTTVPAAAGDGTLRGLPNSTVVDIGQGGEIIWRVRLEGDDEVEAAIGSMDAGITVLTEDGRMIYIGADPEAALAAIDETEGRLLVYDESTGTWYLLVNNDDANEGADEAEDRLLSFHGMTATGLMLGDNDDAVGKVGETARAILGLDGDTATVNVDARDRASGTLNKFSWLDGTVISTRYVDVVTRQFGLSVGGLFRQEGGVLPGYMLGGIMAAAHGNVIVGEAGPEILNVRTGLVTPSPASRANAREMLRDAGSGTLGEMHFHFHGPVSNQEDAQAFLSRALSAAFSESWAAHSGGLS